MRILTRLWTATTAAFTVGVLSTLMNVANAASALSVTDEQFLFMPVQNHTFEVVEVLNVKNASNALQNIEINLPSGFEALTVAGASKASTKVSGQNLVLSQRAKPNAITKVTLTYALPMSGQSGIQTVLHSTYSVVVAHLYLPIGNSALSAPGLMPDTQTETISGTTFRVFTRPGIPAGDSWPLSLELLPSAAPAPSISGLPIIGMDNQSSGNTLQALGNLAVAVGILVIGLISIRSTQWGRGKRTPLSQEEALYRAWESLEWQYEQGMLEVDQFSKKRSQLKRRLAELTVAHQNGQP